MKENSPSPYPLSASSSLALRYPSGTMSAQMGEGTKKQKPRVPSQARGVNRFAPVLIYFQDFNTICAARRFDLDTIADLAPEDGFADR